MTQHPGWKPDFEESESILADPDSPVFGLSPNDANRIRKSHTNRDPLLLTDALVALEPNFKRGNQALGSCVAWGWEIACSIATAVDIVIDGEPWNWGGQYATEPIYGGSRCESRNRSFAGWQDGSYGAVAAKWITKWGVLGRKNYSIATGNPEHDLRSYDGKKEKNWGAYGCGGKKDKGELDAVAKDYPCKEAVLITSFDDAANSILNGWPIAVCSGQGFTRTRDSQGFCKARGSWSHCMAFVGVRFDRPGLLCMNSWGPKSNSGPHGIETHSGVMGASFWVDASIADRMLRQKDSYAVTGVNGLEPRDVDFGEGWAI